MPSEALTSNASDLRCSNQEDSLPDAFKHDFSDRISSEQSTGSNRRRRKRKRARLQMPSWLRLPTLPKLNLSLRLPKFSLPKFTPPKGIPKLPDMSRIPSPGWFPLIGASLGFVMIMLFVSSGGQEVDANVSIPQEEWLTPTLLPETDTLTPNPQHKTESR